MADPASISALVASWFTPSSLFLFVNLVIGTIALTSRFATPKKPTDHPHEFGPHAHDGSPQLVRSSSLLERFRSFHYGFNKYDASFPETEHLQPLDNSPPQLVRTPSLLERVKSFQFGFYNYEPTVAETVQTESVAVPPGDPIQPQLARSPSLLERLKSMNFSSLYRSDSMQAEREGEGEGEDEGQGSNSGHDSGNLVKRSKSETREGSPARLPERMRKSASEKASSSSSRRPEEEEVATVERRRPETARTFRERETASFGEDEAVDAKADDFINRFKQHLRLQRLDSILRNREMLKGN